MGGEGSERQVFSNIGIVKELDFLYALFLKFVILHVAMCDPQ